MKSKIEKLLHVKGLRRSIGMYLVNHVFAGTRHFEIKRKILNTIGFSIGKGTKVVAPIECTGTLTIGENCWIGKNLKVNGNGYVTIGDNCDIAPEVTFQTGGHEIGGECRRAGKGIVFSQRIGNGVWIGGRVTILGNTVVEDGCVLAGCACVTKNVLANTLVGGVPAKVIRSLECENDSENTVK